MQTYYSASKPGSVTIGTGIVLTGLSFYRHWKRIVSREGTPGYTVDWYLLIEDTANTAWKHAGCESVNSWQKPDIDWRTLLTRI